MTDVPSPAPPLPAWQVWLLAARPKTLPAAAGPVLLGTSLAAAAGQLHVLAALCALLGALLIQIGTNYANDYADFVKGADTEARKGPTRATASGLAAPQAVRRAAGVAFGLAVVAGLYLIWRGGWPVLAIGVASILSGILYTSGRYALAYIGLGELFVLVFFGPVAVAGTYYVQALAVPAEILVAGIGPGLLSVAILLANNIRDVEEDRVAGKRTPVVRFGRAFGVGLYAAALIGAALVPLGLWLATHQHRAAVSASVVLALGAPLVRTLHTERTGEALNPVLGRTGRLLFWYCLLFGLGWILP